MIKDSGSNYNFNGPKPDANVQYSAFDESYVNSFTADEGRCYPSYFEYTLPGDKWNLGVQSLIRVVNNPVVPLASRQRAFYHTYWSSLTQLWKYAEVFFPKGYTEADASDLASMQVPTFTISSDIWNAHGDILDMMGYKYTGSDTIVPAFKFMMYLRIGRDYHINKKLVKNYLDTTTLSTGDKYDLVSKFMFPRFDGDFIIGSSQWDAFIADDDAIILALDLCSWRYFSDDYFSTALLTPMHGEEPFFASNLLGHIEYNKADYPNTSSYTNFVKSDGTGLTFNRDSSEMAFFGLNYKPTDDTSKPFVTLANKSNNIMLSNVDAIDDALRNSFLVRGNTDLTMDSLRNLACATAILEKMAKTDGTYGEFARAYFGITPKNTNNYKPKYVGGDYTPIMFTDVVNTADSQGTLSGKGIASNGGSIGSLFCDDYGITMTIFSILPDVYYTQGVHKQDLYKTSDDFYLPERSKLGMQAILNDEIYFTNDEAGSRVFGYQNRCDEYRYRYNECHGKVADPLQASWSPYIEKRIFASCPTLSHSFCSTKGNISAEWKYAQNEIGYFVQVLNSAKAVRPLPYMAKENNLGF